MYFHTRKMCFPISWWHTSSIGRKKGYANKKVRLNVTPHTALIMSLWGRICSLTLILYWRNWNHRDQGRGGRGRRASCQPGCRHPRRGPVFPAAQGLSANGEPHTGLLLLNQTWFCFVLELQLNSVYFAMGPLVFPGGSVAKSPPDSAGDVGSIPGSGRSPGEGNGNPFQYSHLENSMGRGAWRAAKSRVAKSQTWLNDWVCAVGATCLPNYIHGQRALTSWTSLGRVAQGSDVLAWVRFTGK